MVVGDRNRIGELPHYTKSFPRSGDGGDDSKRRGHYLVRSIPAEDREAVRDALPVLLPADFCEAAGRIRQTATRVPI